MKSLLRQCMVLFACIAAGVALVHASEEAGSHDLPDARDLPALATASRASGLPILLMFSAPHCEYCERLEGEVLKPLQLWLDTAPQALIGKVSVGDGGLVRDFRGQHITPDTLADQYQVDAYPTLMLLDAKGTPLVPHIVGYQTPEFYGAYLDAAIAVSQRLLDAQDPSR